MDYAHALFHPQKRTLIFTPTHPHTHSIGFGDLTPSTEAGKGFTIVFALLGVSLVALSVGEISSYLIEVHDDKVKSASTYTVVLCRVTGACRLGFMD